MRGKLQFVGQRGYVPGITPAGAGKTLRVLLKMRLLRDHPRRCGENCTVPTVSSLSRRITPAGAGKTGYERLEAGSAGDHPRRCGENRFMSVLRRQAQGSPPQVRGKHYPSKNHFPYYRITPAGAGKTIACSAVIKIIQDHPRRCGEN